LIDRREILDVAAQTSLTPHVVEKDYVLGWMLAGISRHSELTDNWVFKGGTCLKKCFFETYRFSEDLDFTLRDPAQIDETFLKRVFAEISERIHDETGIEIPANRQEFEILQNPRGKIMCQGKISYKGPVSSSHGLPRIKLDLTADERIVLPPVRAQIFHPYSDAPKEGIEVLAYDYVEAFAEKFRALAERTRPRDLYDVVNLYRNFEARPEPGPFADVLRSKCDFKGMGLPRLSDLEPHRADLEAGWVHMLDHQLPALLPVSSFWDELPEIFAWLAGGIVPALTAMPIGGDAAVIRDRMVTLPTGTKGQTFIDLIRFAATNRLLVEIDYVDKQGVRSTREIEAYSLRRSKAGDVLLMAVRAADGEPRSYLVEKIVGVRPTQKPFKPRYPIELTPSGLQSIPRLPSSGLGSMSGLGGSGRTSRLGNFPSPVSRKPVPMSFGPTYVFRCPVCEKTFNRKSYDGSAWSHKNKHGQDCYGSYLVFEKTT
jgi:predicted nucleotidyltransferase component of viral defense system